MRILFYTGITLSFLAVSAGAQTPVVPESWGGIWSESGTERDCSTFVIVDTWSAEIDTLCPGPVSQEVDGFEVPCAGTISETTASFVCTADFVVAEGCTATMTLSLNATRSGDTINGAEQFAIVYVEDSPGDCFTLEDSCTLSDFSSTRISTDTSTCPPTPVLEESWGSIKTRYE